MPYANAAILKRYPCVRLLACLITGIVLQWFLQFSMLVIAGCLGVSSFMLLLFILFPPAVKFTFAWLRGVIILFVLVSVGALITYCKDIRHDPRWAAAHYQPGQTVLITIEEPLVEKPKWWKAVAAITAMNNGKAWKKLDGKAILYFYKGKKPPPIQYGTQIILHKPLQTIKNSGNPGAFDYEQYCILQEIGYQAFIYPGEFVPVPGNRGNAFKHALFAARDAAIAVLKNNIPGEKEQGVAEALLIGYRAGLDADLVQAYTNAGIIHIIAISGLHQAMIYALLAGIWSLFPTNRFTRVAKPVSIFIVLWVFALLAGAMPSICRATIMFSFLIVGQALGKRTNTYNNLAASAFILLVYNPFYLWDAGFVLSYSAVLSIVVFYRPVYNRLYIKNKVLDKLWASTAITVSVQIFTLPVILFYFHQFTNFFLITNFLAVPASCIILYGEIVLLLISFIAPLAHLVGLSVGFLIGCLNSFIEYINRIPNVVWGNIYADVPQTFLLYACIIAATVWFFRRSSKAFIFSIFFVAILVLYNSISILSLSHRQKLIVYNVSKQTAIDIIQGNRYHFVGDSVMLQDGPLQRYNLKPARTMYRLSPANDTLLFYGLKNACVTINHTKILMLDNTFKIPETTAKTPVDIIILSKKPKYTMADINKAFTFKQLVFDSSNPLWKIRGWKKDCDSLHLRFYSVPDQGAFEMNL
jgi:competence protein ComEC